MLKTLFFRCYLLSLFFTLVLISSSSIYAAAIDRIVIFGDSLSDDGNAAIFNPESAPPAPPYATGKYSNGPVWPEYLANTMNLKVETHDKLFDCASKAQYANCAFAGALLTNSGHTEEVKIPDVQQQISQYITQTQNDEHKDQHLYILWAGGNDYIASLAEGANPDTEAARLAGVYKTQLDTLINYGAKTILVLGLPDIGSTPLAKMVGDEAAQTLTAYSIANNKKLSEMVKEVSALHPNTKIVYYDVLPQFQDMIANPSHYQCKNVSEACVGDSVCEHPNEYLFWDNLHPTTHIHQLLSEYILAALKENNVV